MGLRNFARGALDAVPNGLQFAQAVNQGQLANQKMQMEREQFDTQQRLLGMQIGAMEEELRPVDPNSLAFEVSKNSAAGREEALRFLSAYTDKDGRVASKYRGELFKYINSPEVAERLYPQRVAEINQEIANKKAMLTGKGAGGNFALTPQQKTVLEGEISTLTSQLDRINSASSQWWKGQEQKNNERDYQLKKRDVESEIAYRAAMAAKEKNSRSTLSAAEWSTVNNNILTAARKEFENVRKDMWNNSSVDTGKTDSEGKPIRQFMVYETKLVNGKPVQYQRQVKDAAEYDRVVQRKWNETYNRVRNATLIGLGLGDTGMQNSNTASGSLSSGSKVTVSMPDGKGIPSTQQSGGSSKPVSAVGSKNESVNLSSVPTWESAFGKFSLLPQRSPGEQARALVRELKAGTYNMSQYSAYVKRLEADTGKKFEQLLREK